MKDELGIAGKMFRILSDHGVNIEMISTSPIRISCVVRGDDVAAAVQGLHDGFSLGAEEESAEQWVREQRLSVRPVRLAPRCSRSSKSVTSLYPTCG